MQSRALILSVTVIAVFLSISINSYAGQFGNIMIIADSTDLENVKARIEGSSINYIFKDNIAILWNLYPGGHYIQIAFPDERKSVSIYAEVYPGLTTRIVLENSDNMYNLESDGFVDQGGHLLLFDRNDISLLPGEINDGIGQFGKKLTDSTYFSYGNLGMAESINGRNFNPGSKSYFDYALISLSNPFAGYDDGNISLISNFQGPDNIGGEAVYGSRNQRFYRINAARALPRNIGVFFGALNFENHDDAAPRANVDEILNHNSTENVDIMAGAGLNINTKIKSDFRFVYKRNHRDYYLHRYYFDYEHSPREEQDFYKGRVSINGWLSKHLFGDLFYQFDGYESKIGDAVHFDNLEAYYRDNNYLFDESRLFYSWDDIDSITPDIDESHVYNRYTRVKTSGNVLGFKAKYHFQNNIQLFSDISYKFDQYRKYDRIFASSEDGHVYSSIGFDSVGNETTDGEGYTSVPKPKRLNLTLGGKYLSETVSIQGAVDIVSFNPGSKSTVSDNFPYDISTGNLLLKDADTQDKVGYRLCLELSDLLHNDNSHLGFFFNAARHYEVPKYGQLYTDYNFFEKNILGSFYIYPFGNPNLKLKEHQDYELGFIYRYKKNSFALSYNYRRVQNEVNIIYMPSIPFAYSLYYNDAVNRDIKSISLSYMSGSESFVKLSLYTGYYWFKPELAQYNQISWNNQYYEKVDDFFRINSAVILRPARLIESGNSIINKALARTEFSVVGNFLFDHGAKPAYILSEQLLYYNSGNTISPNENILEVNIGMTATILDSDEASFKIAFEILNLFDRENQIAGYTASIEYPSDIIIIDDDWLEDPTVSDSSGLTNLEKYNLFIDNPNNYGRPRVLRISARLEF